MRSKTGVEAAAKLRTVCRANGLKVTPQRLAVYDHLVSSHEHPTADEVRRQLRHRFPSLSLDTVNRTLITFAKIGLIQTVEGHGRPRRYDANLNAHHHAHCIRCGRILDFTNTSYDRLKVPEAVRRDFTVLAKKVVLSGICRHCREEQ